MIDININDETSQLKAVVLGIADDFGGTPSLEECYDPKSKEHVLNSTFPVEEDCVSELNDFKNVLKKYNVNVFRPKSILKLNQIFSRDIAFVIENKLFISNIIIDRAKEINAIEYIIKKIPAKDVIQIPSNAKIEGDVILHKDYIFIGYSNKEEFDKYTVARTNKKGLDFVSAYFPNKKIIGFELRKSDVNARKNALHLDCCFQPIGKNMAIIYKKGFKNQEDIDFLISFFGCDNLIELSTQEMYDMNSNIFFNLSENVIVSEKSFIRLNNVLRSKGFVVEEVSFNEISKMEGLLRCSTMPLLRI